MSSRVIENPISRSLALHLVLIVVAFFFATHLPKPVFSPEPVEITLTDPPLPKSTAKESASRTIVQPTQGEEVEKAKRDAFLSDRNRSVHEQFSAKNPGEAKSTTPRQSHVDRTAENKKSLKLSDFGVKITPKGSPNYNQERNWVKPQMGEMIQGGQYIQGMKEGEVSALNTKEFVFYSYFERVRKQLDQAWQPIVRDNIQRIFKSGRRLASNSDYVTRALVTLNSSGQIVKVQVLEQSGTQDLDQAAVDALNRAGPYPNPPRGLVNTEGLVEIRWDFILKT